MSSYTGKLILPVRTVLDSQHIDQLDRGELIATVNRLYDTIRELKVDLANAQRRLSRKKVSGTRPSAGVKSGTSRRVRKTSGFVNTILSMTSREMNIFEILRIRDELEAGGIIGAYYKIKMCKWFRVGDEVPTQFWLEQSALI